MRYGRVVPRESEGLWFWECYDVQGCFLRRSVIGFETKQQAMNNFAQDYSDFVAMIRCRLP